MARLLQLKVVLQHIEPAIWRRLQVPAAISLQDLHLAIQMAMGWTNSHLYQYRAGEMLYTDDFEDFGPEPDITAATGLRLADIANVGDTFEYEYDLGDMWDHSVTVEVELDEEHPKPVCIDGARRCPPENVGGTGGYATFLIVLDDIAHPEHEELLSWVGGDFDPEDFSAIEATANMQRWIGPIFADQPAGSPWNPPGHLFYERRALWIGNRSATRRELLWPAADGAWIAQSNDQLAKSITDSELVQFLRPWLWLLGRASAGLKLTQAGNLPPSAIAELSELMGWPADLPKREADFPALEFFRDLAADLKLTRKHKGELRQSRLAAALVDEPRELWKALVRGWVHDEMSAYTQAADLVFATVARGKPFEPKNLYQLVGFALRESGWRYADGEPLTEKDSQAIAEEWLKPIELFGFATAVEFSNDGKVVLTPTRAGAVTASAILSSRILYCEGLDD